jgi:hypothetical protein
VVCRAKSVDCPGALSAWEEGAGSMGSAGPSQRESEVFTPQGIAANYFSKHKGLFRLFRGFSKGLISANCVS